MQDWQPPRHWTRITTIDTHTGGEPFRVITSGFPDLKGNSILEKRRYVKTFSTLSFLVIKKIRAKS
jgi:proline racemase